LVPDAKPERKGKPNRNKETFTERVSSTLMRFLIEGKYPSVLVNGLGESGCKKQPDLDNGL
jgi:hypothetical protein